ncbi:gp16 family protein [Chrysiogenes arsenatis]|uniref:gp16 family protein n=1 Tax=Chrysiogenes arsenatis TaxID=309797 RepID=UPI00041AFB38|nr:regulatory protein GemA [Chrysiogenes arsenatis]
MALDLATQRKKLIRVIHVAKRDMGLSDDVYRGILLEAGGAESAADLNLFALERVLKHLRAHGFKIRHARKADGSPVKKQKRSRPLDVRDESRKIRALWLFLHEIGVVKDASEAALAAYVKRICRVDALQWTNGWMRDRLIESLKKWAMRFLPAITDELLDEVSRSNARQELVLMARARQADARERNTFVPYLELWALCMFALGRKSVFNQDLIDSAAILSACEVRL